MIKGLSRAGVGDVGSLENFIKVAAKHGFGSVDSGGNELVQFIEKHGLDQARKFLEDHHMVIGSIGLSVEWRTTEEAFRQGLAEFTQGVSAAASLGCRACCTYVLPSTDLLPAPFMAAATRRLRICAQILDAYGMKLGLEFVGPHHLRTTWKHPFLWTMADMLDWIHTIGEANVGLLLDAYHWYTTESNVSELLALESAQIVHVHINDAPNVPIAEVLDNDRLYPGEGVIDLAAFLGALQQIGYRGVVAQEILTPQPVTESSEQLILKSAQAYRKVYASAGLSD